MVITKENIIKRSEQKKKKIIILGFSIFLLLLLAMLFFINFGRAEIDLKTVMMVVHAKLIGNQELLNGISKGTIAIIWDIRIPRIIIAVLVGSGLAVAGAVFQSLLVNPLADSYTLGVSTGAAFGAVVAIYLNLFISEVLIPIMPCAFAGAILTLLLVIFIARKSGSVTSTNLIIAGIIVGSILSSGISFLKSLSGEKVSAIIFWLLGSLSARGWNHVAVGFPFIIAGIIVCIYFSRDLNILSLGEKEARFLGVNPRRTYIVFFIAASMITAACVSISGIIGFVGLIVPHLLRFSLTSDNRVLLPLSALLGGVLLLMADTLSRVLLTVEIPVGVLTTLLGGPFFLYIFIKKNRGINPF